MTDQYQMHIAALKQAWAELTAPGADFETVPVTVGGEEFLAFRNAAPDLSAAWKSAAAFADREYIVFGDERMTYAEAHEACARIRGGLIARGVTAGDRVALVMRNLPEWMLIYWACTTMGVVVVALNAWWRGNELELAIQQTEPKIIFADEDRIMRLAGGNGLYRGTSCIAVRTRQDLPKHWTHWPDFLAAPPAGPADQIDPDSAASILFTSGTSGSAKGAVLTHRGCTNNLMNVLFAGRVQALATDRAAGGKMQDDDPPPAPVVLITTPLFHVTANNCAAQVATLLGGKIVLMNRWDPAHALDLIEAERVTTLSGVPTMTRELVSHPDFALRDTSSLQSLAGGGAPLQPDILDRISAAPGKASVSTGYGMTEASGVIASISGSFLALKPESCGQVLPTFSARCVDEQGVEVAQGEAGELWVRGVTVIPEYFRQPEASSDVKSGGWLRTGDVARFDEDGFLYIVDRKKDMILRGGENVFCPEIEAVISRHPDVAECCVFGVPDERLGETVGAAVRLTNTSSGTAEDILRQCREALAAFKVPEQLWIVPFDLPKNASGKYLKRELRQQLSGTPPTSGVRKSPLPVGQVALAAGRQNTE